MYLYNIVKKSICSAIRTLYDICRLYHLGSAHSFRAACSMSIFDHVNLYLKGTLIHESLNSASNQKNV